MRVSGKVRQSSRHLFAQRPNSGRFFRPRGDGNQAPQQQEGGFHVVLGPKFNQTGWGEVRFKHEDLPSPLIALAGEDTAALRVQARQGRPVPVLVLMLGRLIPEESLIYDFSHEVEGRGLIMPVVRVEAVEFVLEVGEERRP